MIGIGSAIPLDIEKLITTVGGELNASSQEDKKVTGFRVQAQSEKIQEKRQERIDNIQEQITGASKSGGCLKFFVAIFKIFDLLTKPLSAITGGQLKLELGKVLEQLQSSRLQHRILGLKINGDEMQNALQGLKNLFQEDVERIKEQESFDAKESQQVLRMLEEIHDSFKSPAAS